MEEQKHYLSYAAEEIDRRLKKVDDIPTKTSELVNNSGFITKDDIPEVELPDNIATLDDVAKKQDKLIDGETIKTINGQSILGEGNITIEQVGGEVDLSGYVTKVDADRIYQPKGNYALEDDIPEVPTKVGELENDKGYITLAQVPSVDLSEYAKTSDIPTVPTRVSAFENDALYLKEGDIDLTPYAKKSEIEETYQPMGDYATKEELNSKQDKLIEGEGISIEGNVISCVHDKTLYKVVTELPEVGEEHKIYLIVSTEQEKNNLYNEWAYINGAWEMLGTYKATIDLEPYALKEDIPTKVSELKNDLQYITVNEIPESETYVLNFTIKDGINTGEYDAEEYAKLRAAIEAGKLIIIGGAVTRVTADSQAMAADYVVIRYGTPRISDDNSSVTMSIYELKFSATEYSSKAVHKVIK